MNKGGCMEERFGLLKKRFLTSRIEQELDMTFIIYLWDLIEDARMKVELDYLQIIKLTKEYNPEGLGILQGVHHSQEQPPYSHIYKIPILGKLIEDKIYIIDEPNYSVMLFASEY